MKPASWPVRMLRHPDEATLENRHLIWDAIREEVAAWRRMHRRPSHHPIAQLLGRPDWALKPLPPPPDQIARLEENRERWREKRRLSYRYRTERARHAAAEKEALRDGREVWRGGIDRNGKVWKHQVFDWEVAYKREVQADEHAEAYWRRYWEAEREKERLLKEANEQALAAQRELNRQAILKTYTPEMKALDAEMRRRVRRG